MTTQTDRIEKETVLGAPRSKVWRALTDARQFGAWFRATLEGDFVLGQWTRGKITYPGYEHLSFEAKVEAIEPETRFAFRWHPHEVDRPTDPEEPTTLVEFFLDEIDGGTRLRVVESGFDRLPPGKRRDEAFRSNDSGWTEQMKNIEAFLAEAAAR